VLRTVCSIFLLLVLQSSWAGKVRKAFAALEVYNYFEAKRSFEKFELKHPVAASYGLSIIYQRKDNPFTNLDSAYAKIIRAVSQYPALEPKLKLEYALFGLDSAALNDQRELISADLYQIAVKENLISSFQRFMDMNSWSSLTKTAEFLRDSLAFEQAILKDKSSGFEVFLTTYPNSVFGRQAKSAYDRLLYVENTSNDNFVDYLTFLNKFPDSPYRPDAEDRIYEISTRTSTTEAYAQFIRDFPANHNVNNAWKKLFNAHLQKEYSLASLEDFQNTFPDYPFHRDLEQQIMAANLELFPVMNSGMWGFMSDEGEVLIDFVFEEVDEFGEGLAPVRTEEKYGYVNNLGEIIIAEQFDEAFGFSEGHAVVKSGENWGMINRSGEFVIQPVYSDLGTLNEGLIRFEKEGLYGYFDKKGSLRISPVYTDASDFNSGLAIVALESGFGLIDGFNTVMVPLIYERIVAYDAGLYKAKLRSNWGIINEAGDSVVPFIYDFIGEMRNGIALVDRGGQFNYITAQGKPILENWIASYPECRQLAEFSDGYAKIKFERGFNLIDTSGKKLFSKDQQNIGQYGDPIAVLKGKNWGYVSKAGASVIPATFTLAGSFKENYAPAGSDPLWGLINKKGQYVIEPYFEEISPLNDSLWIARSRGNYGLLTTTGDTLLNFSYLSLEPTSRDMIRLQQNGSQFYYNLNKRIFVRKEE